MTLLIVGTSIIVLGLICLGIAVWRAQTPKHKHWGTETGRRYVPGMLETGGKGCGFISDDMIYGYTEITYKCECGHYWNQRVVGRINESRS